MEKCFFVTDLHGEPSRYEKLFASIEEHVPPAVFVGGDILPGFLRSVHGNSPYDSFVTDYLAVELARLKKLLGSRYPRIFIILGNDDGLLEEEAVLAADELGLWEYCHGRSVSFEKHMVYGYSFVPPTPFRLKDWEKYDVSRYVDPGCVSPLEGFRTVSVPEGEIRYGTIAEDLQSITRGRDLSRAIFLFHSPPYRTSLDRAALDGKMVDHAPLDVHVGSIAIRRFIEASQPPVTLHGHIHESASITGSWKDTIGRTVILGAAHDGPELALVLFDPDNPSDSSRRLL